MDAAREHFLADPRFAEQHDGHLARGDFLDHRERGLEACALADQFTGRVVILARGAQQFDLGLQFEQSIGEAFRLEILQILFRVVPLRDRSTDDATVTVALRGALDLTVEHEAAKQFRGVPGGVSDLHPARGCRVDPVVGTMDLRLVGVLPDEFAFADPARDIHFVFHRAHVHDPLEIVQLRAHDVDVVVARVRKQPPHEHRIARARGITHAGQYAACAIMTQGFDQFAAQFPHRTGVDHDHALLVEPDLSRVGHEAQA